MKHFTYKAAEHEGLPEAVCTIPHLPRKRFPSKRTESRWCTVLGLAPIHKYLKLEEKNQKQLQLEARRLDLQSAS